MNTTLILEIFHITGLALMIVLLITFKNRLSRSEKRIETLTNKIITINNELADYDKQINDYEQRKLMFFYLREYYLDNEKYLNVASCDRTIFQIDSVLNKLKDLKKNNVTERI